MSRREQRATLCLLGLLVGVKVGARCVNVCRCSLNWVYVCGGMNVAMPGSVSGCIFVFIQYPSSTETLYIKSFLQRAGMVWRSRKEDLIAKPANHYLFESVCVLCVCMGVYSSFTEPLPLNVGPQYSAQFICLNRAAKVVLA